MIRKKSTAAEVPEEEGSLNWSTDRIIAVITKSPFDKKEVIDLFEDVVDSGEGSDLCQRLFDVARRYPVCIRRVCGAISRVDRIRQSAYKLTERVQEDPDVLHGQLLKPPPRRSRSADGGKDAIWAH